VDSYSLTISPDNVVVRTTASRMSSTGHVRMSRSSTTKSASFPGSIEPSRSSTPSTVAASVCLTYLATRIGTLPGITHIETAPLTTTVKRSGTVLPRR